MHAVTGRVLLVFFINKGAITNNYTPQAPFTWGGPRQEPTCSAENLSTDPH